MAPDDWMRLGMWDLRRHYVRHLAEHRSRPEVVGAVEKRLGLSPERAAALYDTATDPPESVLRAPALLEPHRRSTGWLACRASGTRLSCHIGLRLADRGVMLDTFVYDGVTPQDTGLRYHRLGEDRANTRTGMPAAIITASFVRGEVDPPSPAFPDVGVVIDVSNQRVLLGAPPLIRSTFFNLLYLDGRYSRWFEKVDDRSVGYHVATWKERWEGLDTTATAASR